MDPLCRIGLQQVCEAITERVLIATQGCPVVFKDYPVLQRFLLIFSSHDLFYPTEFYKKLKTLVYKITYKEQERREDSRALSALVENQSSGQALTSDF